MTSIFSQLQTNHQHLNSALNNLLGDESSIALGEPHLTLYRDGNIYYIRHYYLNNYVITNNEKSIYIDILCNDSRNLIKFNTLLRELLIGIHRVLWFPKIYTHFNRSWVILDKPIKYNDGMELGAIPLSIDNPVRFIINKTNDKVSLGPRYSFHEYVPVNYKIVPVLNRIKKMISMVQELSTVPEPRKDLAIYFDEDIIYNIMDCSDEDLPSLFFELLAYLFSGLRFDEVNYALTHIPKLQSYLMTVIDNEPSLQRKRKLTNKRYKGPNPNLYGSWEDS